MPRPPGGGAALCQSEHGQQLLPDRGGGLRAPNYVTFAQLNVRGNSMAATLFLGGVGCIVLGVLGLVTILILYLRGRRRYAGTEGFWRRFKRPRPGSARQSSPPFRSSCLRLRRRFKARRPGRLCPRRPLFTPRNSLCLRKRLIQRRHTPRNRTTAMRTRSTGRRTTESLTAVPGRVRAGRLLRRGGLLRSPGRGVRRLCPGVPGGAGLSRRRGLRLSGAAGSALQRQALSPAAGHPAV